MEVRMLKLMLLFFILFRVEPQTDHFARGFTPCADFSIEVITMREVPVEIRTYSNGKLVDEIFTSTNAQATVHVRLDGVQKDSVEVQSGYIFFSEGLCWETGEPTYTIHLPIAIGGQ